MPKPQQQPQRLALIITELDVGGAERCLTNLACGLDRARFAPRVYALGPPPPSDQRELLQRLEAAEIPVCFGNARSVWQFWSARRQLQRWLADQQPHLVQTFLFHANVLGALAGARLRIPNIALGIRVADPTRWRQGLERYAARCAQRIVCVSQSVAGFAEQAGLPRDKLVVVANGIQVDQYPARQAADLSRFGIPPAGRVLLYVGRLHRQKGVDWLLELAPELLNELPEHHLLLVGQGPQRAELESHARASPVSTRIHFAGWRSDVPEILRASELLVLPSRWEGMPNVLLEAMASRLPLVAAQAAGVAELLGPLAGPQTAEFGSSADFRARLAGICRDPALAKQLGSENRKRVENCFSVQHMISRYESLYTAMLGAGEEL